MTALSPAMVLQRMGQELLQLSADFRLLEHGLQADRGVLQGVDLLSQRLAALADLASRIAPLLPDDHSDALVAILAAVPIEQVAAPMAGRHILPDQGIELF